MGSARLYSIQALWCAATGGKLIKGVAMKSIAIRAYSYWASTILGILFLAGCSNMGTSVGINFPIGNMGGVGVSVGSDGRIGGSVGVGVGAGSVSVGTSGKLPTAKKPETAPQPAAQ
jgi:hypothetical protein